jgi:hypothetical protein
MARSDDNTTGGGSTDGLSWRERLWPSTPPATRKGGVVRSTPDGSATRRPTGSSTRPVSTKKAVERLDDKERRFSLAGSFAALLLSLAVYLLETQDKVHFSKNTDAPITALLLGLGCGVLLLVSTLWGRRAPVGFVALLTFLVFGTTSFALGLPFLALAGWLLYRSYKIQKEATALAREARGATEGRGGAGTSRTTTTARGAARASSTSTSPAKPSTAGSRSSAKSARPEPNKRFTPKRPPPSAPKPSRRERKAAQASD